MEIFFHDPEDVPLPPDEVHIREFKASPYPDGRRISVYLETCPFQKRPSGEVVVVNPEGKNVASVSIIETIDPKMEMTLHIRAPHVSGIHTARALLFYEELPSEDEMEQMTYVRPERTIVDEADFQFEMD